MTSPTAADSERKPAAANSTAGASRGNQSQDGNPPQSIVKPNQRIAKLPDGIATQIAAGEVIERPASIVKELIENSCDAGATRIQIVIEGSGVERIRVSDDGRGMSAEELALAFQRHATSKLRRVDDLATITTYGFRGEALPSIAAAADVDCLSRVSASGGGSQNGSDEAARVRFEAGRCLGVVAAGGPPGTTMEVRDLFARQPARRKFLTGARAERAAIARVCGGVALARPDIAVTLEIDGRTVLASEGRFGLEPAAGANPLGEPNPLGESGPLGTRSPLGEQDDALLGSSLEQVLLRQAFAAVWDVETAAAAIDFDGRRTILEDGAGGKTEAGTAAAGEMRAWGLAASPSRHRGRRGGVQLFVNRRPVESRRLVYAVEEAYADLLPQRRYPIVAVFLDLPPDRIDVNVHPTKATVKLRDEAAAFGLIQKTLRAALLGLAPALPASTPSPSTVLRERPLPPAQPSESNSGPDAGQDSQRPAPFRARARPAFDLARGRRLASGLVPERHTRSDPECLDAAGSAPAPRIAGLAQQELPGLPLLRVVGQLRATFIIAEGPEGMVLLDQHAAHERVVYESLLGKAGSGLAGDSAENTPARSSDHTVARQPLLDPPLLELSAAQAAAWASHDEALALAGFELEDFGDRSLRLRAVPAAMGERDARASLFAVLDDLAGAVAEPQHHDPVLASTACHASVRAGQTLDVEEMRTLLRDLERCNNPQTCPHGRPTLIEFAADDLYRRFGR